MPASRTSQATPHRSLPRSCRWQAMRLVAGPWPRMRADARASSSAMSNIESSPRSSNASRAAVRSMTAADLRDVARLHAEAFPRFFLSGLGLRTLREMYAGMLADTTGITIVAETGGRVIGFAAGTTDARSYYRRLFVRRWWRFALAMIPALLRHPSLAARLLWRVRSAKTASPRTGEAVLLSLAVAP